MTVLAFDLLKEPTFIQMSERQERQHRQLTFCRFGTYEISFMQIEKPYINQVIIIGKSTYIPFISINRQFGLLSFLSV